MSSDKGCLFGDSCYLSKYGNAVCHPNAPAGSGGPGRFRQAFTLGADYSLGQRLPHPNSPAARYLTTETIKASIPNGKFDVEKIPAIMRVNKWNIGASLMDSWFSRKATIIPAYDTPNTSAVTMEWVLGFKQAKEIYDKLVADQIWANEPARKEIEKMLRLNGMLRPNSCYSIAFGDLSKSATSLDKDYINQRTTKMSSELDDLNAALANFVFNIVVAGKVRSDDAAGSGYIIEIEAAGIYVKDSYDFEGEQFLGFWDDVDNSVSMYNMFSGNAVSNNDFRKWRSSNNRGGDFVVFSDVKAVKVNPSIKFRIPR